MSKRSRKRSSSRVDRRDLAPLIAEGYTEGVPVDRIDQELPTPKDGAPTHLNEDDLVEGTRIPKPKFFAEDDPLSVLDIVTGRTQRHARITLQPETLRAMKAGWICLRCMEPQDEPFPETCTSPEEMACNYPIRERQLRDIATEYEGEQTLGPGRLDGPS